MYAAIIQMKHHKSLVGLIAGVIAIIGLLPDRLRAEDEFVEQFKFSGGIVVAIDFDDGQVHRGSGDRWTVRHSRAVE